MKQHITEKQWDELNTYEQDNFIDNIEFDKNFLSVTIIPDNWYPNIGNMIEFLKDRISILELYVDGNWHLELTSNGIGEGQENVELCDLLWEGVKNKLRK